MSSRLFGPRLPSIEMENSLHIPGNSILTQNGPFKMTDLRQSSSSTSKKKQKSNTLKTGPTSGTGKSKKIRPDVIEKVVEDVMVTCLKDVKYEAATCIRLSQTLAGTIMEKIKPHSGGKYKMVAVVSIGNVKEKAGMQFGSRCLWNKDEDSFLSVRFANETLFAVAMVYCLLFQ